MATSLDSSWRDLAEQVRETLEEIRKDAGTPSLAEFVSSPPKTWPHCAVCELPEAEEINALYRNDKAKSELIHKWLVEVKGREVTLADVRTHKSGRHAERRAK